MKTNLLMLRNVMFVVMVATGLMATSTLRAETTCYACGSHWSDPDEWCGPIEDTGKEWGADDCEDKNSGRSTCSVGGTVCFANVEN